MMLMMRRYTTERDAADALRSQLAEREANAAEIARMLAAADEEKERLCVELTDTTRKLADVQSQLTKLAEAEDKSADTSSTDGEGEEEEKTKRLSAELSDTKRQLADVESKLLGAGVSESPYPAKPKSGKKGNRKKGTAGSTEDAVVSAAAAEEEKRLQEDVNRLEKSLAQQDLLTSNLEKVAEETQAYAADLKKQLTAALAAAEEAEAKTAAAEEESGRLTVRGCTS
jgi:hypothetical protein